MPPTFKRKLKNTGKSLLRRVFELGQHCGFDILPRHFYSEIPDLRVLKKTVQWKAPRSLVGIPIDMDRQVAWVDQCTREHRNSLKGFEIHRTAVKMNGTDEGYGEAEADLLYCFVRTHRPSRIAQVGCGVSTAVCIQAARDEEYRPRIMCIEPYPSDFLKRESDAGNIELVPRKVEDSGLEWIEALGDGDLFFVDSSHALAPAGEVNVIILEVLPRLAAGVYVHFHDIHFPYDYSPDTLSTALFFQHETALLHAFLLMNPHFEISASLALLRHWRLKDLIELFPDMEPQEFDQGLSVGKGQSPSSIFLRRLSEQRLPEPR